jgi:hypothetical protein
LAFSGPFSDFVIIVRPRLLAGNGLFHSHFV